MTEQTTPLPYRSLRLLKGGTKSDTAAPDSVPQGDTEGDTAALPVPVPAPDSVSPLSAAERAQIAARHWGSLAADGAGQMWLHPDRLLHEMWKGQPQSMDTHLTYVKSAAWVPEELRGHKSGAFLTGLGWIHYVLIAWPLKLIGLGLSAAADRALRFYLALAVVLVFVFLVTPHIHF